MVGVLSSAWYGVEQNGVGGGAGVPRKGVVRGGTGTLLERVGRYCRGSWNKRRGDVGIQTSRRSTVRLTT